MLETKILIVEDDEDINNLLKTLMEDEGYEVVQAFSGSEAMYSLDKDIDLYILDLMLPGLKGEELIGEIRKNSDASIMVISGKTSLEDRVNVLELGADDYMMKPFENIELLARIRVLLRRRELMSGSFDKEVLEYKEIVLNTRTLETKVKGELVDLTQTEFLILMELMKQPKKVFSRDELYQEIWGYDYLEGDNAITVHISHLRQKLRKASGEDIIGTVWGVGYRLK